jgi:hypothetical protein
MCRRVLASGAVMKSRFAIGMMICALTGCVATEQPGAPNHSFDSRLNALRIENEALRTQISLANRDRMWQIGKLAMRYAAEHKEWPRKPSDLKSGIWWTAFIAPYDTSDQLISKLDHQTDVWDWIDANSSYVFFGGSFQQSDKPDAVDVVFQEKREFTPGLRWQYINDGHLELEKTRRVVRETSPRHTPADGAG